MREVMEVLRSTAGLWRTPSRLKEITGTQLTTDTISRRLRKEALGRNPRVVRDYFPSSKKGTLLARYCWNTDRK
jgi:hypothetical protein